MKKFKIGLLIMAAAAVFCCTGCFNLDEEVYSEITEESFTASQEDIVALMGGAYVPLQFIMDWQGLFDCQEEPGDIIITPVRPNGWSGIMTRKTKKHECEKPPTVGLYFLLTISLVFSRSSIKVRSVTLLITDILLLQPYSWNNSIIF